jgi:hypothetical protein
MYVYVLYRYVLYEQLAMPLKELMQYLALCKIFNYFYHCNTGNPLIYRYHTVSMFFKRFFRICQGNLFILEASG